MGKTAQPAQEFPIRVEHGDFSVGGGHWFRVTILPDGNVHAQFDMKVDGDEENWETIEIDEIARLEQTSGQVKVGAWLERYLFRPSVLLPTANISLDHLRDLERSSERIRFVCETHTGQYFCAEIDRNGFRLVQDLMEKAKAAST